MNASANMETRMFGSTSLSYLITFRLLPLLTTPFSAFMAGFLPVLTHLIRSGSLIACRKYHMKDLSAIYYGPTPMIDVVGVSHLEAQATHSARISVSSSTILITS